MLFDLKRRRKAGGRENWVNLTSVFDRLGWGGSRFEMKSKMRFSEDRCGISGGKLEQSSIRFWLHIQSTFSWSCAPLDGTVLRGLSFLLGQKVSCWF